MVQHADIDHTGLTGVGASGAVTSSGLTMATARILGRTTASTGAIEEITVGTGLSLAAGNLTATGSGATIEGTRLTASGTLTHNNSGGFFEVLWDTETVDDGNWHSLVSATGRITVASAGWVTIVARVEIAANATGTRAVRILRNGSEIGRVGDAAANVLQTWECTAQYKASASDYFQVEVFQNSSGNLSLNANGLSSFSVLQVR